MRGAAYYVSHYTANEIINPDLEFEDISVKVKCCFGNSWTVKVQEFTEVPAEDIVGYDNSIFPYERKDFMLAKFQQGFGRVAYDKSGKVVGIGLMSMDTKTGNCDIGPMYCDGTNIAQAIFQNIVQKLPLKDVNEIRVRCSDHFEGSAKWALPILLFQIMKL